MSIHLAFRTLTLDRTTKIKQENLSFFMGQSVDSVGILVCAGPLCLSISFP